MTTPTVTWFKTPDTQLGSGTTTVTLTGRQVGELVVACTFTDFGAAADLTTPTGTAVASWTLRHTSSVGASNEPQQKCWTGQISTAGGTVIGHGPSSSAFGMIVAVSADADSADFPDDSAEAHSTVNTTAHTAAGVSPTGSDDRLIVVIGSGDSDGGVTTTSGNYSNTAGMTNRARVVYNSGTTRYMDLDAFDEVLSASGATGTRALVYGDNAAYTSVTVALRGASGTTVTPSGIAVPVAAGTPTISQAMSATPSGIPVAVSPGTPATSFSPVAPTGVAVPTAPGAPAASQHLAVTPNGLPVPSAAGAPTVAQAMTVAPAGIGVPVTPGVPAIGADPQVPGGIAVPVALGTPAVSQALAVSPTGIGVPVVAGAPAVAGGAVNPTGLAVPAAVGAPSVAWTTAVSPAGIAVPAVVGSPVVTVPGSIIHRPNTGTITRPSTGVVVRPNTGVVPRP